MNQEIESIKSMLSTRGLECYRIIGHKSTSHFAGADNQVITLGADLGIDYRKCLFVGHLRVNGWLANSDVYTMLIVSKKIEGKNGGIINTEDRFISKGNGMMNTFPDEPASTQLTVGVTEYNTMLNVLELNMGGFPFTLDVSLEGLLFICK
jgi:hypothetical protein